MIASIGLVMCILGLWIGSRRDPYVEWKDWFWDTRPIGWLLRVCGTLAILASITILLVKHAP